jgi:hypothetical protein
VLSTQRVEHRQSVTYPLAPDPPRSHVHSSFRPFCPACSTLSPPPCCPPPNWPPSPNYPTPPEVDLLGRKPPVPLGYAPARHTQPLLLITIANFLFCSWPCSSFNSIIIFYRRSASVIWWVGNLFVVFRWLLRMGNRKKDEETPRRRALAHEEALAGDSDGPQIVLKGRSRRSLHVRCRGRLAHPHAFSPAFSFRSQLQDDFIQRRAHGVGLYHMRM